MWNVEFEPPLVNRHSSIVIDMILPEFTLHRPTGLNAALDLAKQLGQDYDYLAGGTDLLPNYKQGLNTRKHLISLANIPELEGVRVVHEGLYIGALTKLGDIADHPVVKERCGALVNAVDHLATPLIRNSGTLGGNLLVETRCFYFNQTHFWRESKGFCLKAEGDICLVVPQKQTCYAVFSGDTPPALMVLDAEAVLKGPEGERRIPMKAFYTGDGIKRHVMKRGEILTHLFIPESSASYRSGYRKLRLRDAFDFPALGVAVSLRHSGTIPTHLSVVIGAVASTPLLFDEAIKPYLNKPLNADAIIALSEQVMNETQPVRNVMSLSARYRKRMVGVYLRRLLTDLIA